MNPQTSNNPVQKTDMPKLKATSKVKMVVESYSEGFPARRSWAEPFARELLEAVKAELISFQNEAIENKSCSVCHQTQAMCTCSFLILLQSLIDEL